MATATSDIKDLDIERYCIAGLLRYPKLYADISNIISENDFCSKVYKTVFSCIRELAAEDEEKINEFIIFTKIGNMGITFSEISIDDLISHLEEIKTISINEKAVIGFFKDLRILTARREIFNTGNNIAKAMRDTKETSLESIMSLADKLYTDRMSLYVKEGGQEFEKIFDSIEEVIELRGNEPIESYGYFGPFKNCNELWSAPFTPADINIKASRSAVGKTSFAFFEAIHVIKMYKVPLLWIDMGELNQWQLQIRAVCAFTKGKVSTDMLKRGTWRKNPETTKLVRSVWPLVEELKDYFFFRGIGGMNSKEICSTIKRFWLSQVGRFNDLPTFGSKLGGAFPIEYDYIKPVEASGRGDEWQEVGEHIINLKNMIVDEVPGCISTYLQINRSGITRGRKAGEYDLSEASFSMSDRIYQNATNAFIIREKTLDELALENSKLGNRAIHSVKKRDLGEKVAEALTPVRMPDGSLTENYVHLNHDAFHWEDMGTLAQKIHLIGQKSEDEHLDDDSDILLK